MNNAKKEEINGMGKTRDLFKEIRNTNRTFHAKRGAIKDRNSNPLQDFCQENPMDGGT